MQSLLVLAAWMVLSGGTPHGPCASDSECAWSKTHRACYALASGRLAADERQPGACRCDVAASACVHSFSGEVTCKTWRDCSAVLDGQGRRPVPAKVLPREHRRQVRPCRDAEWDSVCAEGVCKIVAWKC